MPILLLTFIFYFHKYFKFTGESGVEISIITTQIDDFKGFFFLSSSTNWLCITTVSWSERIKYRPYYFNNICLNSSYSSED